MAIFDEMDAEIAQEIGQFYADPRGFVQFCYPWGVAGSPLAPWKEPDKWQIDFLEQWGDEIMKRGFNGVDPVTPIRMSIASGHGIGKLEGVSTIINTPNGQTRWGDLKPGDLVFGSDGSPTMILQVHEHGVKPLYKVTFDDGAFTFCGAEHLWAVRGRQDRRKKTDEWRVLSTEQIMEIGVTRPNGVSRAKQWEIPIQGPAQFTEREIDLHPYVLGLWIGDGSKGQAIITKPYWEIGDAIRERGYQTRELPDGKSFELFEVKHLFKSGVFELTSPERYIPDDYKFNTIENRIELLRGLLDSDGEAHASGSIGYSTTSERLIHDVIWLVRSLGGKAMLQPTVKQGWYPDPVTGERIICRDCFRATINICWNPFTLGHRRYDFKPSEDRYTKRWIASIEYSHEEDSRCISVSAPDHLYLTRDFIVTHNSALSSWIIHFIMSTRMNAKGVVTSGKYEQLKDKTWSELAKWRKLAINGHWFEYKGTRGNLAYYREGDQEHWTTNGQACTKENADSFAGLHNASSTPYYLFDEASAVPDEIYEVAEGGLTDGEPMIFLFGNPTKATGKFADTFGRQRHRWINRRVDSRTARMTNKEVIQQWITDYGEDSDFVRVRVKGEAPRVGDSQFISTEIVEMAQDREVTVNDVDPIVLGVDVARFGDDCSVIVVRQGRKIQQIYKYREMDLMQLSSRVVEAISLWRPHTTFVDGAGIGAGVVDRLRQLGYHPIEVQAGSKADIADQFINKRAEMWWRMREWLETADIPKDDELKYDLIGIEYSYDARMRVQMEKKADMKARGLPSPDCFVAGTTVLTPNGEKAIETFNVGDEVITPVGISRVVKLWESETDRLTTASFSNGSTLTGKGTHKIFTWDLGWVAMDALALYNRMESSIIWSRVLWVSYKKLFTKANRFSFSQQVDIISRGGKTLERKDFFIAAFGQNTTDRLKPGFISITEMVTGRIMIFQTWRKSLVESITNNICSNDFRTPNLLSPIVKVCTRLKSQLLNGTDHQKVSNGTDNMDANVGRVENQWMPYVPFAGQVTKLISPVVLGFVPQLALSVRDTRDIKQALATVFSVVKNLRITNLRLKSVVPVRVETASVPSAVKVYNLTLDTENVYYANGILVKNCADALSISFAEPVNPIARPRAIRKTNVNWRTL